MDCPNCGKPMEEGVLSILCGGPIRPKWHSRSGTEVVHDFELLGPTDWSGYRCSSCKLMTLKYGTERPEEPWGTIP